MSSTTLPTPAPAAKPKSITGFSLVELSIVLVILGLLVGGILSGQALIRASEMRSISTQYNQFYSATRTFKDKYFALPGDMPNATQFWGAADIPTNCPETVSSDSRTCDGDGNQKIDESAGSHEDLRAWQHLTNAGLIEGQFDGVTAVPHGKLANSRWDISDMELLDSYNGAFNGEYGNSLIFHTIRTPAPVCPPLAICKWPALPPEDAWNINTKMDDGSPATGSLAVFAANGLQHCTTAVGTRAAKAATLTASYLLTSTEKECALVFRNQF